MKNYLLLIMVVLGLTSCSTQPDNIIHGQSTSKEGWVLDSATHLPVQADVTYYKIAPTWGQSIAYAEQRKDRLLKVVLALLCVIAFIALFLGRYTDARWYPEWLYNRDMFFNILLFLLLAGFTYFYFGDASGVKWNNDKWVKKEVYDKAIKEAGSTQPIWDSLSNNHLIVDGPY